MVEIREETGDAPNEERPPTNAANGAAQDGANGGANAPRKSPLDFIKQNPNEVLSFGLRLATLYFVAAYILPIASPQAQKTAYTKAFAAAAATNAFRLHQRMRSTNGPVFSQQFLVELMLQDSAHYLFYCLIMVMSSPITLALLPIFFYALFHIITFLNQFATEVGYISPALVGFLVQAKQQHSVSMLSTVALAEIFLLPILVVMIFWGKANLFTPFVYYRFLTMRYMSRRNPYTREMFAQLKQLVYSMASHQACPAPLRTLTYKTVSLIERLAPQAM